MPSVSTPTDGFLKATSVFAEPANALKVLQVGAAAPEVVQLFDFVENVLFWMKDREGHYQWVNVGFLLNFGLQNREEVLGRTDFDLCGALMANQYRVDDERVLSGERILSRVELIGRFDHTSRWCVTSKIPLHDPDGAVVGTVGVTAPTSGKVSASPGDSPLSAAIRYVGEHYAEPITNQDLAQACGLSVRSFERHFQATYQTSPHDYVRQMRVRLSCQALVYSRQTLADIAHAFGFADQSHFTKEFGRVMDETPGAYRARFTH